MRTRTLVALALVVALLSLLTASGPAVAEDSGEVVTVRVLSDRADLVTGGDALVEVTVPSDADVTTLAVDVDGRDVTAAFAVRSDGRYLGLITGLSLGTSRVTAELQDGRGARLDITNHAHGGPAFSGPQIQPWGCSDGAEDDQCNREPRYEWHYMPEGGGGFQQYDPDNPPDDVGETTTDEGHTVPYIVREENGVIDRDQYRIAVLFNPDQPWSPTEPQQGWNRKLVLTHGASCDTAYEMGSAPDVMNETALERGFAVASHALDNAGHNCNIATQAESLAMTKEYLVSTYGGPVRYTIGTGCSGGALTQQQVANAYPGIYQGILPQCSYPDAWSSAMQYIDYYLLLRYFQNPDEWGPGVAWAPNQIATVNGHPNISNPITFTTAIPNSGEPSRDCPGVPEEDVYNEETNPGGVRCTLQDYMVNIFGRRPASEWSEVEQGLGRGFANRPWDNVGVQYGLSGLADGTILPHQFVDLNTKIGAGDYNLDHHRQRSEGAAIDILYRSGANNTASNLDQVAIIDLRGPDPGAFHDVYRTYALRERIIREHGDADNHILWRGSVALIGDANFVSEGIVAMDEWLAAVEADDRDLPLAEKIAADKPESLAHRCTDGATGTDVPSEYCDAVVQAYSTPRIEAGMPTTDDVQKCQLVPLDEFDYGDVTFNDDQWAALEEAFPEGVCDYSKPGVDVTDTVPWLDYSAGPGGEPMGPAPQSVPYGVAPAGVPARASTVHESGVGAGDAAASRTFSTSSDVSAAPALPATGGGDSLWGLGALVVALFVLHLGRRSA